MFRQVPAAIGIAILVSAAGATAGPITFVASGTSGSQTLNASATFSVTGSNLEVVLSNDGGDVLNGNGILAALFFNLDGNPTLSRVSAIQSAGSATVFETADPGGVVGGEWSYRADLSAPGGATQGISSGGFGLFNATGRFPGSNLQGNLNVSGLEFGLTSALDNLATGNAAVTGNNGFTQNSVTFLLGDLPGGFDPARDIRTVGFKYGTNVDTSPFLVGVVPEPVSAAILAVGLAALGVARRRAIVTPAAARR